MQSTEGPVSVLLGWMACSVRRVGIIDAEPEPTLLSTEGGRERLVLVGEGPRRLAALEAHLVEVTGRRTGRWVAIEGYVEGPQRVFVVDWAEVP